MTIWLDAQLPPSVAAWIEVTFGVECRAVRDLGLRNAKDHSIFLAARDAGAIVMTKDKDFVDSLERLGPPPIVLWVTCGNTSNARLREVLTSVLPTALRLLEAGESLVEIADTPSVGTPAKDDD
jgi:predicted nuclease of predicted toxin-antitoxin system